MHNSMSHLHLYRAIALIKKKDIINCWCNILIVKYLRKNKY
jgi:hypothetical protein